MCHGISRLLARKRETVYSVNPDGCVGAVRKVTTTNIHDTKARVSPRSILLVVRFTLLNTELALVRRARFERLPVSVGLLDDLQGGCLVEAFFIKAEGVERLIIGRLVPAEPLTNA
jgi:hypothetical protein